MNILFFVVAAMIDVVWSVFLGNVPFVMLVF